GDFRRLRAYMESRGGLRSTGHIIRIYDGREEIGFRELPEALYDLHPGAIYYHASKPYMSIDLDLEAGKAFVREIPGSISYYTRPLYTVDVEAIKPLAEKDFGPVRLVYGEVKVTVRVEGYVLKEEGSGVTLNEILLHRPLAWSYWTKGVAGRYPNPGIQDLTLAISSYHALEHVLITASKPVAGVADTDLGGVSYPSGHIIIYDSAPGGNGASRLVLERIESTARVSEKILESCTCEDGCPRCVFSPYCGNNNRMLSRNGALKVLRGVLSGVEAPIKLGKPEGKPLA
ncbi:MAG: Zn-binding domain-containing protein, partial [Acidilobaceae archaeon]